MTEKQVNELIEAFNRIATNVQYLGGGTVHGRGAIEELGTVVDTASTQISEGLNGIADALNSVADAIRSVGS